MSSAQIPRFLIPNSADQNAEKLAVLKAFELAKQFNCSNIALLVPVLSTLEHSKFADILGAKLSKSLIRNKSAFVKPFTFTLETEATFKSFGNREVVLGVYLTQKGLDRLDSITNAKAILLLSWLPEEAEIWTNRWNPQIIGEPLNLPPIQIHPDVEKELKRLTLIVNLSTGLAHPLDRKKAEEMFQTLKAARLGWVPEDIKSWAIRNSWEPRHAQELAKLSEKYLR